MQRLRPYPVLVFCAVTLVIWTNRIWLAWTNDADSVARKVFWSVPITLFELAAIVLVVAMLAGTDRTARWFISLVRIFGVFTILFWAIRTPMIWFNEHPDLTSSEEVAFKIVHTVLAVASIASAAFALRAVRGPASGEAGDGPIGNIAGA